jgi:hypothetical protein
MNKLLKYIALVALLTNSIAFADELVSCDEQGNKIKISEILQKWSESMNKKIKLDIPYDLKLIQRQEANPTNIDEFSSAFDSLNQILDKGNLQRLHACVFDQIIVIVPAEKDSENDSCSKAGLVKQN